MVAYSFKERFVMPIRAGLGIPNNFGVVPPAPPKRQTIRAHRRRHARPGEEIQLYRGMRTKACFLIGRARCTEASSIVLGFDPGSVAIGGGTNGRYRSYAGNALDEFARQDGFVSWEQLVEFWREEHSDSFAAGSFSGVIIFWEPLP